MTDRRQNEHVPQSPASPAQPQRPQPNQNVRCPQCKRPMTKRPVKFKKASDSDFFWGCSGYPNCKYTKVWKPEDDLLTAPQAQSGPTVNPLTVELEQSKDKWWNLKLLSPAEIQKVPGIIKGSPEQEAIWHFMLHGKENGSVDSVAGSGKSFTIVQGGLRLVGTGLTIFVCAFNKHIEKEMTSKLRANKIDWMFAKTTHSLGGSGIRKAYPSAKLDKDRLTKLINRFVRKDEPKKISAATKRLVSLCKNQLLKGTPDELRTLMLEHSIDLIGPQAQNTYNPFSEYGQIERLEQRVFELVPQLLTECIRRKDTYDFDDQIWWSVVERLPVDQCDMLLVDETQDTNRLQQELIFLACPNGRIVTVGDTFQAIYGFRGADTAAMATLFTRMDSTPRRCKSYRLTVTRRCAKSHVRLAQAIVPHIRALDDAPEGIIESTVKEKAIEQMVPGDLVICRVNSELVPVCFSLLKRGVKAQIKGRDFARELTSLIKKLKVKDDIPDFIRQLHAYAEKETAKYSELPEEKAEELIQALMDKTGAIEALCEGLDTVDDLIARIDEIFSDFDQEGSTKEAVVLGTIHRTKGLEATNVFILKPELIPHPAARRPWAIEQERNLAYIAVTRAKYTKDDQGNLISDGRLIFMGPQPMIYSAVPPEMPMTSRYGAQQ